MPTIDILYSAHPRPAFPVAAVGSAPIVYLNLIPIPAPHIASLAHYGAAIHAPIDRTTLRTICRDPGPTELAKYACIMAWGGQRHNHFTASIKAIGLPALIAALVASVNNRTVDFDNTKAACAHIAGLGISFFTKLLFFLRPNQDAYILDQWTAKSISLLVHPSPIPLSPLSPNGYLAASPTTTGAQYDAFCRHIDTLATTMGGAWVAGAPGEALEIAIFDRSHPDGFWRAFTRINFTNQTAGRLLQSGEESLTCPLDYRSGLLMIKRHSSPRIYVIQIHGSCCSWALEDCYRFLLARAKELRDYHKIPVTIVLPPGDCPDWFRQALLDIQIDIEAASTHGGAEGNNDDDEIEPQIGPPLDAALNDRIGNKPLIRIQLTKNGNYFSLRQICGQGKANGGNYWGNVSNNGILAIKQPTQQALHAAGVIGVNPVANPWNLDLNQGVGGGAGYIAHRDFGEIAHAFDFLAPFFDLCACDQQTLLQLNNAGIDWINVCGEIQSNQ